MGGQEYGARLSYNLSAARVRAGLTVEQVAATSGVEDYERIERGEMNPTVRALCDVAEALGVGVLDLLEGVEGASATPGLRVRPPGWTMQVARRASHRRHR